MGLGGGGGVAYAWFVRLQKAGTNNFKRVAFVESKKMADETTSLTSGCDHNHVLVHFTFVNTRSIA